jgi:hypothetical protein
VRWLCDRVATRARRVVERRPWREPEEEQQASVFKVHGAPPQEPRAPRLHARVEGWDLHASPPYEASDRVAVERFIRYGMRGPIASGRLTTGPGDKLTYRLKAPKPDGTSALVLSPMALLERLAKLVPLPGSHRVRYFGVLANASRLRKYVVPRPPGDLPFPLRRFGPRRIDWATLMKRVFLLDVLACACGGTRRIIASIEEGQVARRILRHLGLPDTAPKLEPARLDQHDFWPTGPPPDECCDPPHVDDVQQAPAELFS